MGTAPRAVKHAPIAQIRETYGADCEGTRDADLALTMSDCATAREIGISLLPRTR